MPGVTAQGQGGVVIRAVTSDDVDLVLAADVFDHPPDRSWTLDFLQRNGHHLVFAVDAGEVVGFVTGVEIAHPDKAPEMLLYELGVQERHRRRGIGRALVRHLVELARVEGCREMWVPVESGDAIAIATYRSAGAGAVEECGILTWHL